jgi:hypothetical protein
MQRDDARVSTRLGGLLRATIQVCTASRAEAMFAGNSR